MSNASVPTMPVVRPEIADTGLGLSFLAIGTATRTERRIAIGVAILSAILFLAAAPFARAKLAEVPAFMPGYVSALIIISLVTAIILIGQFVRLRSWSLLALCAGYFFDAGISLFYLLSFPGTFAPHGVIGGGEQTTAWLYTFWHAGMPLFIIAYAVLDKAPQRTITDLRAAMLGTTILVAGLIAVLVIAATVGQDHLPPIMRGGQKILSGYYVLAVSWLFSFAGLIALWRKGLRTSLDIWVAVAMLAWACDVGLSAAFNHQRYDLGYYVGRFYGLAAISFVLGAMLVETTGIYSRVIARAAKLSDEVRQSNARTENVEAQLRQAQKMEAIGALTGGLAHDFNNLLAVVIGNLDLLMSSRKGDKEIEEFGGEALSAAERGADLTRRLLAFARRQPLQPKLADPNELVRSITQLLRRTLGESVEITLDLEPDLWRVVVDPAQFDAALANLATNARDAMGSGGNLIIVTGNRHLDAEYAQMNPDVVVGDYVMIEVTDTGSGMAPDVVSRIFEPFFTTKETGKGTGLGLSMVYGFVKQSGGHIAVSSELGIGTTFRIYLPRDAGGRSAGDAAPTLVAAAGGGETVLAVEDNPSLRRIVTRQLRELGYRVFEAENAQGALDILSSETVDLLFTDVVMAGGMSGIELAHEAERRNPGIRVLVTSGFPEAHLNGTANGDVSVPTPWRLLSKPYRKDELAHVIREVLDSVRQ